MRWVYRTLTHTIFCLLAVSVAAQTGNPSGELLGTAPAGHKVMIIPFDLYNYFSDADPALAKANDKKVTDVSTLFRYGLCYNVNARIISQYNTYNILADTALGADADLSKLYASLQYEYERPMNSRDKDSIPSGMLPGKDLFGFDTGTEQDKSEKHREDGKVSSTGDKTYLNAVLLHPEILRSLQEKYGTDLFLFINQFELVTNYTHCLDQTANYFERKVIVHYSIYNADGKELRGDSVTVLFSSGDTDIDDIIGKNFPVVGDYLAESLREETAPRVQMEK